MSRSSQMTLGQLELFVALVEAGGFSAAGARLGISQSSVSHTVKALEQALGTALFDRRQAPPALTDGAQRLLPHARALLSAAEAIRQEVQAEQGLKSGLLRIGSFGPSSSLRLLPQLLRAFALRHPGVEVRVDEEADGVIAQWLVDRRVELGFVTLPEERFDTVHLASDEYVVVLPERHPLAAQESVRPRQLHRQPFIASSAGCGDEIAGILARAGAQPLELFRMPQVISVLGLVAQGLGVSVSVRLALPDAWPGVVYRPFLPTVERHVALAMLDRSALSPAAQAFVAMAQAGVRG
ncbi:MAG TPA: LysR family transcriptional regulator [Ideonella sp.]|uniref:LysR family transcriptional regulator n=1 Tax=Ideonella sp. TaxID=1929293 RepID=UPI002E322FB1|nr:LysR family transcriptional regulator [Ideonella sp.]HEX5684905.1 LysR family transcriptional regulator [Ideonella sp.]